MNDWIVLGLALGLLCGGLVAGRRLGSLAAIWLAGGSWLGFRLADRLWRPVVEELRKDSPDLDLPLWIPVSYGVLFVLMLIPVAGCLYWLRPKKDFVLPGMIEDLAGAAGGGAVAFIIMLGSVQAHVMHPLAPERIPRTLATVRPMLSALGQRHVMPHAESEAPAAPAAPVAGTRDRR